MRIVIVSSTYPPYLCGVSTATANLAEALSKKHQLIVITATSRKKPFKQTINQNLTIHYLPGITISLKVDLTIPFPHQKKLKNIISRFAPDIIHLQEINSPIVFSSISLAKQLNIPLVMTHHFTAEFIIKSIIFNQKVSSKLSQNHTTQSIIYKLVNSIYNKCQLVTIPNQRLIPYFKRAKLKTPIIAIPNGIISKNFTYKISPARLRRQFFISHPHFFLYVGRFDLDKNLDLMIKSFKPISQQNPHFGLVLVGQGNQDKKLKKLVHKLHLNHSVYFLGRINNTHRTLSYLYNAAFAFVSASIIENQSVAFIEALTAGLPIIASDYPNQADFIINQQNGLLYEPENPAALAVCMQKLINNPKLRKTISANNRKKAKQFNISVTSQQYLKAYQTLLNSH